jgi:hypothetical protein
MDDATMVYPKSSFLGQDVWGFERPCKHHPVRGVLRDQGNGQWCAIARVCSRYNMQLDKMSKHISMIK